MGHEQDHAPENMEGAVGLDAMLPNRIEDEVGHQSTEATASALFSKKGHYNNLIGHNSDELAPMAVLPGGYSIDQDQQYPPWCSDQVNDNTWATLKSKCAA